MPMKGAQERAHGVARARRKAAAVNAFADVGARAKAATPTPAAAPEPEPEAEPAPVAKQRSAPQLSDTARTWRGAPAAQPAARFSDTLIANLLGEMGMAPPATGGPARRPLRPSLTAQLASATAGADEVMAQFGDARKTKGLICTALAERFAVAECVGRQPASGSSPIQFFDDRAMYGFEHPMQGRVDMVMYYRDMIEPCVTRSQRLFTFRVKKTLRHFVDEYEPYNPSHRLSLCFKTMDGMAKFEQLVLERITRAKE